MSFSDRFKQLIGKVEDAVIPGAVHSAMGVAGKAGQAGQGVAQAMGVGTPQPPNPTKIPYNNGFYSGPYNPSLPVIDPKAPARHMPFQPMPYAQYMNKDGSGGGFGPNNPSALSVGGHMSVTPVEGGYPQDQGVPMADPTDTINYLQPAYNNPQTSVNGGYQQNQGLDRFGNPAPQNVQGGADPFGWKRLIR